MHVSDSVLKDFLIDSGVVSRGQIDALDTDKSLTRALIDGGVLSEDEVRRAAAHALGIPFVVLEKGDISEDALMMLPEPLCRAHNLAAYAIDGQTLEVAVLDIVDLEALEPLCETLKLKIAPRLTSRDSLRRALVVYQKVLKAKFGDHLLRERDPARALDVLLKHAVAQHASEVHIESAPRGSVVRYRLGSNLHDAMLLPGAVNIVGAIRARANTGSKTLPQEGRFVADLGSGASVSVRVSSIPLVDGEKMVLRLMREESTSRGFTLEGLGLHGRGTDALQKALRAGKGIILVAGSAGSGRTTLLYTLLDMQNAPHLSLASIEENVASRLSYVAQTQPDAAAGFSSAATLRATLRLDPDMVMIEPVEDRDTLALALAAARRGVSVLLGVDAPDIESALLKLRALGMSESDYGLITCSVGVALLRRLCQKQARDAHPLERRHLASLEARADFAKVLAALKEEQIVPKELVWKDVAYPRVTGCSECEGGYRGQAGVYEVSTGPENVLNLFEDALYKAAAGITSIGEVLRFADVREPAAEVE